jgi:hypothetical protein
MEQGDALFDQYQQELRQVLARYWDLYCSSNPGERKFAAGREFLNTHNGDYKAEVTAAATALINETSHGNRDLYNRVFKYNLKALAALEQAIMNDALGL